MLSTRIQPDWLRHVGPLLAVEVWLGHLQVTQLQQHMPKSRAS